MTIGLIMGLLMLSAICSAEEMVDTNITDIVVYPNGVAQVTEKGAACCGSEFYTAIDTGIVPGTVRVIEGFPVESVSISAYIPAKNETSLKRPLTIADMINQSINKQIEAVTTYGGISGTLYMLEGDLMFLSGIRWTSGNETTELPFFTMGVSDIRNLIFRDKPDFAPVYKVSETPQPYNYYSSYNSYYPQYNVPASGSRLSWKDSGNGSRAVSIKYRTHGISWTPVYNFDIDDKDKTGGFGFWAIVTNSMNANLTNVSVKLVAGNIKIQGGMYDRMEYNTATQMAYENIAAGGVIGAAISMLEEYAVYDMGKISLNTGETKIIKVFDKGVKFEKDYVWDARLDNADWRYTSEMENGKVQNIYRLTNEENETWPYGTASVYRDGMLIGEDTISWTPKGREAKVTVGYAPDIEVKKRVTAKEIAGRSGDYDYRATLKMRNYKNEKTTLTVIDTLPSNAKDFESNIKYEEKPGNLLYWNVTLNPGQEMDLTYTYWTN